MAVYFSAARELAIFWQNLRKNFSGKVYSICFAI